MRVTVLEDGNLLGRRHYSDGHSPEAGDALDL